MSEWHLHTLGNAIVVSQNSSPPPSTTAVLSNDALIRFTDPSERDMFTYSYSIAESILTCPVYGLIRYYKRKYYPTRRVLPLEAGSLMHGVFAAVRLWQLYRIQGLYQHFLFHADRLFPNGRFKACWKTIPDSHRDELLAFCFKVIATDEYYDDPSDRVRTIANMEETTIRYVDEMLGQRMADNPIWVADVDNPSGPVGIEQHFDIVLEHKGRKVRYIGTIDGIVAQVKHPGTAMIDENKTAARLDEAWRQSYDVKAQPTGYTMVARMMTGLEVTKTRMLGIKIKQAKSHEDFLAFIVHREAHQVFDWIRSLFFCDDIVQQFGNDPIEAPQFTHACNRYFRACAFIDLCAADPDDKRDIYENSMVTAPLTPSQQALMNRVPGDGL